ncbi:hypothetical protein F1C15_15095 [Frigoribacterium sp. NBH87]|uniref:DUF7169 domain-containing protein n=1 Tax=Frigoribacterium sp. NBH87 TaxID=2596916 RepID=UPI00162624A3|nr:hypothetical protein [Frigoribacterium sp. NBH87]QNE44965.1 hypothetical protein F1C15_15095 [Frigoribacterium sp. NBH87]
MPPTLNQHPYPVAAINRPASRRLPLHVQVRRHAELALRLSSAVDAAMSLQYTPGAYDSAGRHSVGYSDPTGETVASTSRLKLRARVVSAEESLELTARALERRLLDLEEAMSTHGGKESGLPVETTTPAAA